MRRIAIGARPTSRADLAEWYAAILEQQAASGLSVTAFAEQVGLSAWTLYDWRRRLSWSESPGHGCLRAEPKLIEVAIAQPGPVHDAPMVVRLGDGRRSIAIAPGFDSGELRRLVAVLESC